MKHKLACREKENSLYSKALRVCGVYVGSCGNFSHIPRGTSVKHFSRGTLENVAMNKSSVGNNSMKSLVLKLLQKACDL